jgi:hypothetical protein
MHLYEQREMMGEGAISNFQKITYDKEKILQKTSWHLKHYLAFVSLTSVKISELSTQKY